MENDLVWARMKYCPYWPARVVAAPPMMGRTPRNKLCVLFFGTKQFGFVDSDKILSYSENRMKYVSKGKGAIFVDAVQEMDEYINDPVKYKSNALVKSHHVVVKTEHDVETVLGIKREKNSESNSSTIPSTVPITKSISKSSSLPTATQWAEEKQSLIDRVISLTYENHKSTLELKQLQDKLDGMVTANREIETKLNQSNKSHVEEMNDLRSQLSKNHEKLMELTRERDISQARLKQVQNGIAMQKDPTGSDGRKIAKDSDDEYFEVHSILADKIVQKRVYLVHWKGYDASHDSWVEEANLSCNNILKRYKQSKRK